MISQVTYVPLFSTHLTTLHLLRKIFGTFSVVVVYTFDYNVLTHFFLLHRRFCSLCTKLIKHVDGWCPITTTSDVSLHNVLTEYDRKSFRLFCCFLSKNEFSTTNLKLINMLIQFSIRQIAIEDYHVYSMIWY